MPSLSTFLGGYPPRKEMSKIFHTFCRKLELWTFPQINDIIGPGPHLAGMPADGRGGDIKVGGRGQAELLPGPGPGCHC